MLSDESLPSRAKYLGRAFLLMLEEQNLQQKVQFLVRVALPVGLYQTVDPGLVGIPVDCLLVSLENYRNRLIQPHLRLVLNLTVGVVKGDEAASEPVVEVGILCYCFCHF